MNLSLFWNILTKFRLVIKIKIEFTALLFIVNRAKPKIREIQYGSLIFKTWLILIRA